MRAQSAGSTQTPTRRKEKQRGKIISFVECKAHENRAQRRRLQPLCSKGTRAHATTRHAPDGGKQ